MENNILIVSTIKEHQTRKRRMVGERKRKNRSFASNYSCGERIFLDG